MSLIVRVYEGPRGEGSLHEGDSRTFSNLIPLYAVSKTRILNEIY